MYLGPFLYDTYPSSICRACYIELGEQKREPFGPKLELWGLFSLNTIASEALTLIYSVNE